LRIAPERVAPAFGLSQWRAARRLMVHPQHRTIMRTNSLAVLAALTLTAASVGEAQTVNQSVGTSFQTTSLAGFTTSGADMSGMRVTAFWADATSAVLTWGSLGGGSWGVSNSRFTLSFPGAGDTFNDNWTLQNLAGAGSALTRFLLNGAPGNTVFDTQFGGETTGSANGFNFSFTSGALAGSTAQYTNIVNLTGQPAAGDIFETLDVALGSGGLGLGQSLTFRADTDNAASGAVIIPSTVPEPGTWALLATGIVGLAGAARRRQRAAA
jgi:hypothetical protein